MTKPKTAFAIDKHVPLPPKGGRRGSKYPFRAMEVGDSFFVPAGGATQSSLRSMAHGFTKRTSARYAFRNVDGGGFRVWRVA
jgi:hypothetical protein